MRATDPKTIEFANKCDILTLLFNNYLMWGKIAYKWVKFGLPAVGRQT